MGVSDTLLIDGRGVSAGDLVEKLQVDGKLISKLLNLRLSKHSSHSPVSGPASACLCTYIIAGIKS
jgi:hypothetical protein